MMEGRRSHDGRTTEGRRMNDGQMTDRRRPKQLIELGLLGLNVLVAFCLTIIRSDCHCKF
jgi:hypothetical protein